MEHREMLLLATNPTYRNVWTVSYSFSSQQAGRMEQTGKKRAVWRAERVPDLLREAGRQGRFSHLF